MAFASPLLKYVPGYATVQNVEKFRNKSKCCLCWVELKSGTACKTAAQCKIRRDFYGTILVFATFFFVNQIAIVKIFFLAVTSRAAERGGRGGQIAPGPEVLGGPWKFFVGPQSFLWVKYFRAKDKIWAKYRNLV